MTAKARYTALKTARKCPNHHERDALPGKVVCQECSGKAAARYIALKTVGKCPNHPERDALPGKVACRECFVQNTVSATASSTALWREALREYGGRCVDCGDRAEYHLTLAHLNNDGAEHRRKVGRGFGVIRDLKRRGWPKDEGIAIQCANCQLASVRGHVFAREDFAC